MTPKDRIPRHSLSEGELPPDVAYQIVHDELRLDGNARLNVATFVPAYTFPENRTDLGPLLLSNQVIAADGLVADIRAAAPGEVKRLGSAPPIVAFKVDGGGRLEIATNAESESAAIGPYTSEPTGRRRP